MAVALDREHMQSESRAACHRYLHHLSSRRLIVTQIIAIDDLIGFVALDIEI